MRAFVKSDTVSSLITGSILVVNMAEDEKYNLSPSKDTYRSLQSDVSPISAIKELVDNVIDNRKRVGQVDDDTTIDILFGFDEGIFRIEDDSGGIEDGNIEKIFALGETSVESVTRPIGAYGMGAKKAIVRLGSEATIKSRTQNTPVGYGFSVGEEWLNTPNDWEVSREEFSGVSAGTTVIEVSGLRIDFTVDSHSGGSDEEPSMYNNPDEFIRELKQELSETYEQFLIGNSTSGEGEIKIVVNGKEVEEPDLPDWSYTPYDGFHPRHFSGVELDVPSRDIPVYMDLTAGLLKSGGQEDAGTDIYIQDRKIISKDTEEAGGWGEYLPNYQPALGRARFQIRLYTPGRTDTLPWDTQKSNIDPYDPVMRAAFNFLNRAGGKFARARYEPLRGKFTEPYGSSDEHSVSDSPEEYDYSNRDNVSHSKGHTPDDDYPQAKEVNELVDRHLMYGVFAPHLVKEELRPGYKARFNDQSDSEYAYWEIPETRRNLTEPELHAWLEEVNNLVDGDSEARRRTEFDKEPSWWSQYYRKQLSERVDSLSSLASTRDPPNIGTVVNDRKETEDLPKPVLEHATADDIGEGSSEEETQTDAEAKTPEAEETKETDPVKDEGEKQANIGDDSVEDGKTEDSLNTEGEDDSTLNTDDDSGDESQEDRTEQSVEKIDQEETLDDEEGQVDGQLDLGGTDKPRNVLKSDSDRELIIMTPSEDTYNLLCEQLDLPIDASPHEVGEELLRALVSLLSDATED